MPPDTDYRLAEGSSRKRIKISRDDGRPAGLSKSPEAVNLISPAKPQAAAPVQNAKHTQDGACHHEQSLKSLHDDLEAMRQLVTCKICQRFLYEPYALTCGHTFCYSCLSQWMGQDPRKTCPDCRTVIKDQPAPSYLIRELVLIFCSRSALLPDGETSEEHNTMAKEEAEIVAKDKANTHVTTGGLFKGSFKRGSRRAPVQALRDASDNVYRCPDCTHEIEDGRCSNCGIRVRTDDDDEDLAWSDESDDNESDSDLDIALADDFDDEAHLDIEADESNGMWNAWADEQRLRNGYPFINASSEVDFMSDDDDDPTMDGFIDDDPVNQTADLGSDGEIDQSDGTAVQGAAPRRRRFLAISSDENEDDEEEPTPPRRRRIVPVRLRTRNRSEGPSSAGASLVSEPSESASEDSGDDDEDEDDEPIRTSQRSRGQPRATRSHRMVTIPSSDVASEAETDATNASAGGGFSPVQPVPQQHVNYYDDSDVEEDEDDDEHDDDDDDDPLPNYYEVTDNEEVADDESGSEGYDDQNTMARNQVPVDVAAFNARFAVGHHRLRTLGPRRTRYADLPGSDSNPRSPRRGPPTRNNYRAPNAPYRPPRLAHPHPFNLDNTLARIHQRTRPADVGGRRAASGSNARNCRNASNVSSQSSAGGVNVPSHGSASSGSSMTLRGTGQAVGRPWYETRAARVPRGACHVHPGCDMVSHNDETRLRHLRSARNPWWGTRAARVTEESRQRNRQSAGNP